MADDKEKEEGAAAAKGEKLDPIVDRSMAPHFLAASALLLLTIGWSVADEFWLRRPYGHYQYAFQSLVEKRVKHDKAEAEKQREQEKQTPAFQEAQAAQQRARAAYEGVKAEHEKLEKDFIELTKKLNDVRLSFQVARGEYQPLVYNFDHAVLEGHTHESEELMKKIKAAEPEIQRIFAELTSLSNERKAAQPKLEELRALKTAAENDPIFNLPASKKIREAKAKLAAAEAMPTGLKEYQLFIPALNSTVDRCTSCHLATDKPGHTEADWDAAKGALTDKEIEEAKHVYTTHPNFLTSDPTKFDYMSTHSISRFACTSCHWGNGPGTASPEKAHGLEHEARNSWTHPREFMLTPLLPLGSLDAVARNEQHFGNMMEAACSKCHVSEVNLTGAPQLSEGRQIIEDLGCWGCHKITGFEKKELELAALQDQVAKELTPKKAKLAHDVETALANADEALELRQDLAKTTHEIQVAERRVGELDHEIKFIGPDLNRKDLGGLKNKIYWAWLPRWIHNPQHFRPGTWMPNPLLAEDEVVEVAAYVWQQASGTPTDSLEPTAPIDPKLQEEGRKIVESRGCIACHTLEDQGTPQDVEPLRPKVRDSVGEAFNVYKLDATKGPDGKPQPGWWEGPSKAPINDGGRPSLLKKGPHFGPSLARVGEKIRYEWLVEWVKDPKRIQPHTRMPNLRLSDEEARAVATYLTTLRKEAPGGAFTNKIRREQLEDPKLAERGFRHVIRAGCFNCHAIELKDPAQGWAAIPNPGKIGAELSSHGSKPLAQFDFGFIKVPLTRTVWLQTKILEPRIWDRGKYKGDPNDRLRMPRFGVNGREAAAMTTILTGLTDTKMPAEYVYTGGAREQAIIEGERLVRKFNCRSCHVIDGEGQWGREELMKAIQASLGLEESDARLYLPPILNGQGHRTEPEWLFRFLKNPGEYQPLRPWQVKALRMPTFEMSDTEATALVHYFSALEQERYPYEQKEVHEDQALIAEGRTTFVKAQCMSCHNIGEFVPTGKKPTEQGPNLSWSRDRLRIDWIERFVPDPQAFAPGANMPSFFNSKPFAVQSPQDQRAIRALAAYVRQLGLPEFREREGWTKSGKGPQ